MKFRRSAAWLGLLLLGCAWTPAGAAPLDAADEIEALLSALGHEQYLVREAATAELIRLGDAAITGARQRMQAEPDPEIRYRLRFILDNIAIPTQAALVLKTPPGLGLEPGDLITHINSRRVRRAATVLQIQTEARVPSMLRVRTRHGPRDIGPLAAGQLPRLVDYVAPRGVEIAQIVRLFADGYAEEAYDRLLLLPDAISEEELPLAFRAVLAHVAGFGETALRQLRDTPELVHPADERQRWAAPSHLDLATPEKAPLRLELALWNQIGFSQYEPANLFSEPDIRVQRVFVPAQRSADALIRSAELWLNLNQRRQAERAGGPTNANTAGNMLAVCAWMLHELDLQSECIRLIGPRSEMLRLVPGGGPRKWLRVQSDAWLPFLAGEPEQALDVLYDDAIAILQSPEGGFNAVIRNPAVAAMSALFAYQSVDEPRIAPLLGLVNRPGHIGLPPFLYWMQFGLTEQNEALVRDHLERCLPSLDGDAAARMGLARALLEAIRPRPDTSVFSAMESLVNQARDLRERRRAVTLLETLAALASGDGAAARRRLAAADALESSTRANPGFGQAEQRGNEPTGEPPRDVRLRVLHFTARFLEHPPGRVALPPAVQNPILAVPLGIGAEQWLVLARDRRLLRYDPATGSILEQEKPSPNWFPLPLTWPWLGCDETSGRAWVYDRRRLVEVPADPAGAAAALRLNLLPEQIEGFEWEIAPRFAGWAAVAHATRLPGGENGEFHRHEIRANREFVADPELPELAFLKELPENPDLAHVALRGGAHWVIDHERGRHWSSLELADALGLSRPLTFHVRTTWVGPRPVMPILTADAATESASGAAPLVLLSNQGLIRLQRDGAEDSILRIALPGDEPYPELIPESCPYVRKDPRWIYFARLPAEGGRVYRLRLADNHVEAVDLINETLPPEHYQMQSRAALRNQLDEQITALGVPGLEALITEAPRLVDGWR